MTKLIKDVETYKDMFQKTETRLSKKIKELTTENKQLVSIYSFNCEKKRCLNVKSHRPKKERISRKR